MASYAIHCQSPGLKPVIHIRTSKEVIAALPLVYQAMIEVLEKQGILVIVEE
jgi:hypothetical protein